jgi:hypothetical protein
MQLIIDGIDQEFVPIQDFRRNFQLPDDFEVACFEPKDYSGLGRIDSAGGVLNGLSERILASLPTKQQPAGWMNALPSIVQSFERELYAINPSIGLREAEIGFAVSGFSDVLQQYVFALMRAQMSTLAAGRQPHFKQIYGEWLTSTVRVSQRVHYYGEWKVQLVTHAYGRCGLIVRMGTETHYVYDGSLSCPVEGFMLRLMTDIAARIADGL